MRFRRIFVSALIGILLVVTVSPSAMAAGSSDWKTIYMDYLLSQTPFQTQQSAVALCDLDFDGIPELLWGGDTPDFDEIVVQAVETIKNGKQEEVFNFDKEKQKVLVSQAFLMSNFQHMTLFRNRTSGSFVWLTPAEIIYDDGEIKYVWTPFSYRNGKPCTEWPFFAHGSDNFMFGDVLYTDDNRTGISFQLKQISEDQLPALIAEYFAGYQSLGDGYSVWQVDRDKDYGNTAGAKLWNHTASGVVWDKNALKQFLNSWSPKIVLGDLSAAPNQAAVTLNGYEAVLPAYTLFNNNYVKLRDLAALFSGTERQFDVAWDGKAVQLTAGKAYADSMSILPAKSMTAQYSTQPIFLNGNEINLTAYQIGGNNYVRLRDAASALGFSVNYDETNQRVLIQT